MLGALAYAIVGFIELLLGLRFILLLLGANPGSIFVSWIYTWSEPFAAPFADIFGRHSVTSTGIGVVTTSVFDWTTLIALVIYALIGGVIARLLANV